MRTVIEPIYKDTFRVLSIKTREELGFTQAKMSEALLMSERSYVDIETGRSACGTLTALMLILYIDDRDELLDVLKERIQSAFQPEV